jgi:1-phosphofructokinase family hexose kinase
MIFTVNANAAIDHVLFVEDLEKRGTIRAARSFDCIGGKGADNALVLARLGAPHRLISFMAGYKGRILENLYQQNGIESQLIWVAGETRIVTVIIETGRGFLTQISHSGYHVNPQDCQRFLLAVEHSAAGAEWGIAAGSLPAGVPVEFYYQVCAVAQRAGAKMLIDCSGKSLLQALLCSPMIVKLNINEYQDTFEVPFYSIDRLVSHARSLITAYGLGAVMITLGVEGILLVRADSALLACGPHLEPVNPAGAGDAASAALVYQLSLGKTWADALCWAVAAGAAVVQTEATADCSLEAVQGLVPQVQIRLVDEQSR